MDVVKLGNKQKKGVPARLGHPEMFDSKPTHYIGRYKNFTYKEGKKGIGSVRADLYLDDITRKTTIEGQGISTYEYITEMAKSNPDVFGNSIFYIPKKRHWVTENGIKLSELDDDEGWEELYAQDELGELLGSDLVDVPAATKGLFSSQPIASGLSLQKLTKNKNILKANPELAKYIKNLDMSTKTKETPKKGKKPSTLKADKETKGLLQKLLDTFKNSGDDSLNVTLTTAEGSELEVVTDSQDIMVGDEVLMDGNPCEAGEYLLADGRSIECNSDGAIESIKLADNSEVEQEDTTDEDTDGLSAKLDTLIEVVTKFGEKIGQVDKQIASQKAQITKINRSLKSKSGNTFANKASDEDTGDVWDRAFAELKVLRSKENETSTKNIV